MSRQEWESCEKCVISESRRNVVYGSGAIPCDLLICAEAPGRSEDVCGRPLVGAAGKLMRRGLRASGIDLERAYLTNVLGCRPPFNRKPRKLEVASCLPRLIEIIETTQTKTALALGRVAQRYLTPACRGKRVKIFTTFHPAYVIRKGGDQSAEWVRFVRDLEEVSMYLKSHTTSRTGSLPVSS